MNQSRGQHFHFADDPAQYEPPVGALVVRIGRGLRNKRQLLDTLAQQLRLPDYFGFNWDSLEECLRDLSWLPPGQAVVILHLALPLRAGSAAQRTYLELLSDCAAQQARGGHPIAIVFPAQVEPLLNQLFHR